MQSPERGKGKRNPARARRDKASDCWYKQTNKSQGKGKGTGKSKSKVTETSESDNSKQVDD